MTKQAIPELLDLAEMVAGGELRAADAERQVRAALETDHRAAEKAVRELRALILATTAVMSHALATRGAAVAESLDVAEESGSVATVVRSSVRGVRRPSSRNGDGRSPRWTWSLVAATIAVGAGVIGASLLAGGLVAPKPGPTDSNAIAVESPSEEPSLGPSSDVSAVPSAPSDTSSPARTLGLGALIAYTRGTDKPNQMPGDPTRTLCFDSVAPMCSIPRLWVVGVDGTGAHELFPDGVTGQSVLGWSPDGTRLLYSDGGAFYMTDANGSTTQLVDTGCVEPCRGDYSPAFSSDGAHLVFVRTSLDAQGYDGPAGIATMDLASGLVAELSSTAPAGGGLPGWSPDGKQIVFYRGGEKDLGGPFEPIKSGVFIVDSDGQNLRQISPLTLASENAAWSPDGARIVFTSPDGDGRNIYTIRPDGTDLSQLTTDGISTGASWTPDGRIIFVRLSGAGHNGALGFWTMDADGTNAAELVPGAIAGAAEWTVPLWQPTGGPAIVPPPWNPSTGTLVGPPPPTPLATPTPALAEGFSWTGPLHTAQDGPTIGTATLLADGRVLVTVSCSTAAELYDPGTGTFSPTGSLTVTRAGETATPLKDGRVLFAGGGNCGNSETDGLWASAELYNPTTGIFTPTGSMPTPRFNHTATLLDDGRVLVAGGISGPTAPGSTSVVSVVFASYEGVRLAATSADVLATAELYDPGTGTFSPTGSMTDFRDGHTATLLQDGRVLVVGGGGEGYASRTSAELYDPGTGTFTVTGSMSKGRWLHTATLLQDGRVLITGGKAPNDKTYASAELYDPTSAKFSLTGSMDIGRQEHSATLLQDGRVLIAGGYEYDGQSWQVLSSTEMYDPGSETFTPIGSMGQPRMGQTATLLNDGRVLIAGGEDIGHEGGVGLTSAVLYQP
jgi:WD40 repeat protein